MGLVPLAIGLNFDFEGLYSRLRPDLYWGGEQAAWWGPMAIAVIAGLTFATFLTLVILPVLHSVLDDFKTFMRIHLRQSSDKMGEMEAARDSGREQVAGARHEDDEPKPGRELVTAG
jgi:hypothetical protein